jgi:tetratricopeptide (TPR) repeat protein
MESLASAIATRNGSEGAELVPLAESSPTQVSQIALDAVIPIARDSPGWALPAPNRRGVPWRMPLVLVAASVLVLMGIVIGSRAGDSPTLRSIPLRQRVVVAPFRVAGASPSLAYLRDGMVELLSTRLADDSAARSVDAGAVIGAWRASGLAPAMDVPRSTVVRLADRLGAERVVVGGVIGTPSRLVVRATVLAVPSGAVLSQAMVEGSADSLTILIDRLAATLLLAEAGEDDRLDARVTSSLSALKEFLAGQAAFRINDYATAARRYEVALQRDSTFALAALRLALAADRRDEAARVRRGVRIAWGSRSELSERDRAILTGLSGVRFPAPSFAHEQVASWHRAAELTPASAEAWYVFGARAFHDGRIAGLDDPGTRAVAAFNRALLIDSTYVPAAAMLVRLSARDDGRSVPSLTVKRRALDDSLSPYAPFLRWRLALLGSDSAALSAAREQFVRLGPANLRAIVLASQVDAVGLDDGMRALKELRSRSAARGSVDLVLAEYSMALNQGRVRDAEELLVELQSLVPNSVVDLQLRVLAALYGSGDISIGATAARRLAQVVAADMLRSSREVTQPTALCTLAQWQLSTGDTATPTAITERLRRPTLTSEAAPLGVGALACAELLDAAIAVAARRRDARARLARADSLAFTRETAGDAIVYAPLWLARMHHAIGDTAVALAAVRRRHYSSDWPRYLAETIRLQGQLAEGLRNYPEALQCYRRYLELRRAPDTRLRTQVDSVRSAAVRLDSLLSRLDTRPTPP